MRNTLTLFVLGLILASSFQVKAQYNKADSTYKKIFIGSTAFVLANFLPINNKPDFAQLNFGYRLTPKDNISLEVKTWKYGWSLGIPYGDSFEAPDEEFPGFIREFGIAIAYQRYLWKGLYTAIHVMGAGQRFVEENGNKVGNGFQVFNTYRLGYHIKLFKDRFFIEPSIAVTHRPIQTKMPDGFREMNAKWPSFFIGEPGLHFGVNF